MFNRLKLFFPFLILSILICSCSKTTAQGEFTLIMSGSMHGQLDPCG